MNTKLPFFTLFFFLFFTSYSQTQYEFRETPSRVKVGLAIKTDAFTAITGEIPLIVEGKLGKQFSVEAGISYVYMDLFSELGPKFNQYADSDLWPVNPGLGGLVGVKFFPDDSPFDDRALYLGLMYKYKYLERQRTEPLPDTEDPNIIFDRYHIITFTVGKQFIFNDWFLFEPMVGIGYRHCYSRRYTTDFGSDDYYPIEYTATFLGDDGQDEGGHVPLALQLGIRLGIILI